MANAHIDDARRQAARGLRRELEALAFPVRRQQLEGEIVPSQTLKNGSQDLVPGWATNRKSAAGD